MKAGKFIQASNVFDQPDSGHPYPCFGGGGLRGYVATPSHVGDRLLIGRQGALCGKVTRASGEFYATEHAVVVAARPGIDIRWAYHMLAAMNLNQYASKSAQPGLSVGAIRGLAVPVPNYEVQSWIGAILDRLDTRATELSDILTAEIRARIHQYQYYRDRLLNFEGAA